MIAPKLESYFLATYNALNVVILPPLSSKHLTLSSPLLSFHTIDSFPEVIEPPPGSAIFYTCIYFICCNIL